MDNLRTIDLSAWHQVGEGGNGKTYENPSEPDVILKVNNPRLCSEEAIRHEFEVSKAVANLGLKTPAMYELVHAGDAYGIVSERIKNKKSLSRICQQEPERVEEMAKLLCRHGHTLFSTPCNKDLFPSRKEQLLGSIAKATFVSKRNRQMIRAFAEAIPDCDTCVHGDFQPGNLIQSGGECYWIDLDRFAYGDPMFDIGHLFQICNVYAPMKRVQDIFHMTEEQFHIFWDAFAKAYTGKEDHSEFDVMAGRFACLDLVVRTCFVAPSFAERIFFGILVRKLVKQYFK